MESKLTPNVVPSSGQTQVPSAWWLGFLPVAVLLVNLMALGLVVAYSTLNLRPFLPFHESTWVQRTLPSVIAIFLVPTGASIAYLWPVLRWLGSVRSKNVNLDQISPIVIRRAANTPVTIAVLTGIGWLMLSGFTLLRVATLFPVLTAGLWAHFFFRPLLMGLVATTTLYFLAEVVCRWWLWPFIFKRRAITVYAGVWRGRLSHRFVMFWASISFLPLSIISLTVYLRLELFAQADPVQQRVMYAILLIGGAGAAVGIFLAWLLSRTIVQPLRQLERSMEHVRDSNFAVAVPVGSTDEIGTLEMGFNEMTERIAQSYETLQAKNRELEAALEKVVYLEAVKRGLDRFVPDTVKRLIEENPQAPALQKVAKDVSVLFVDIQGYTTLSEELATAELNEIVENYFSMYLSDIRSAGGDINETAGDGLMIIFQEGAPTQHAHAAVRVALAIRQKTTARNQEEEGRHPPLVVNMGVSSGQCEVGSTKLRGTAGERWTFTASGPVTNLAARLGDYADDGQIFISAETAQRVRDAFHLSPAGSVELKNIGHAVEVWQVEDEIRPGSFAH
jgi:class 3 adenylate cyclase/HAMP domain-containing protein